MQSLSDSDTAKNKIQLKKKTVKEAFFFDFRNIIDIEPRESI